MPWNVLPLYSVFERLTAAKMNLIRENLNILKAPVSVQNTVALGANITTTSTTPVVTSAPSYVVNITPSILTGTCNLDVWLRFNLRCSLNATAQTVRLRLDLNGGGGSTPHMTLNGDNTVIHPVTIFHRFTGVGPGLNQINLAWWTTGGTATIFSNTADANYCIGLMMVRES
ncbi:MAG: hypothetical protein MUF38_05730 [Anaerolineae bacterium]|jgi:hypothetical protein|nr:hypothetical protein [Anaerolineae bacterium]